ncbi:MAG: DUF2835 domain-containing protein [Pseudomonadales bacterium]|nr:DUF2835 domain-containing protein [Pseudomonadales bacterium]
MNEKKGKQAATQIRFSLSISPDAYEAYYRGDAKYVQVVTDQSLRVKMPANIFRPFLTQQGVSGTFVVTYDRDKRFQSIEKIK